MGTFDPISSINTLRKPGILYGFVRANLGESGTRFSITNHTVVGGALVGPPENSIVSGGT